MQTMRVAIVGAGPAGIYAADILAKSDVPVAIDVLGTDIKRPPDMGIEGQNFNEDYCILRHTAMDSGGELRRIHLPMRRAKQ
jgi:thioredoxin reductase